MVGWWQIPSLFSRQANTTVFVFVKLLRVKIHSQGKNTFFLWRVLLINAIALGIQGQNGWRVLSVASTLVGFKNSSKIPKASLKMESVHDPKFLSNYKNCFIDGEHSYQFDPHFPKFHVSMGSAPYPLSPLIHFLHLEIFAPYVQPVASQLIEISFLFYLMKTLIDSKQFS
jgi:hypothetical protein